MDAPSVRTARRLRDIPPTVFTTMSALAVETGSVNLGQGFPDRDGPPAVLEKAVAALRGGRNQYPPGPGVPELRRAVAAHQLRHYGIELDPSRQVVITAGATEALAAAMLALVEPGDEVVVVEPFYDAYVAGIAMAGGVRRAVPLVAQADGSFRLDLDTLRGAVGPRTVAIVVNSPHNPTGSVLTRDELTAIADVAVDRDLVVVTDEVYEHLLFDGRVHTPLATLPGMSERTLSISSAGKMFSVTGWKVGWVTGPGDLVASVLSAKQWLTFTNAAPLQPAVAYALEHAEGFVAELSAELQACRDQLCAGLAEVGLQVHVPEGTYFTLTDVRHLGWDDGLALCMALPARAGVVAVPAQSFYDDPERGRHLVRWAFCKAPAVLAEALSRLRRADLRA